MNKVILFSLVTVFGLTTINAQESEDKTKNGGFKVGGNVGLAISTSDYSSFNFGFDAAYLIEIANNFELGLLVGYTQFIADGEYSYQFTNGDGDTITRNISFKDASFVPIAATARYYFSDRRFFGGVDIGYAINTAGDDEVDGGLYYRPKFGFVFGAFALIGSFQGISGGIDYYNDSGNRVTSFSGFNTGNVGIEFSF